MSEQWKCFICVGNRKLQAQAPGPNLSKLPLRDAIVLYQGTGLCEEHLQIVPPQPGHEARRAGLIVPGY